MGRRPPVIDWSADFDHLDPRWTENPYPIWDELRQKCPIAHTERFMGAYFATRYEDVRTIAYDTERPSAHRRPSLLDKINGKLGAVSLGEPRLILKLG